MLKLGAFQRHLQGEYLGGFPVQSAWGSLHTTRLQDSGPQPQGLFACTREGLEDILSLWLVNPAKKALLPMTVPDPPSSPLPNFTGAGNKGAHSLAKPAFFFGYQGMEVSFTQNGNAPNTPYQEGPANAPSLI